MEHQKRRPTLEPVQENYMGPPVSYQGAPRKPRHGRKTAKVAPSNGAGTQSRGATSFNPLNIFGKLRDRYIKTMNEMAMGGDYAAIAGGHGCVPGPDYPDTMEHHLRRREVEALRAELVAIRRDPSSESVESSYVEHYLHER